MTSLRTRQKQERRERMLVAARSLFIEHGYTGTTMDAIAQCAQVGVATVHTYFATKEGLFAELARMDMSELKAEGDVLLDALPADPVEAVLALIAIYIKVRNYITYEVIRDFTIISKKAGPLREAAAWINDWQVTQMAEALRQHQASGRIAPHLAAKDMASIIIDLYIRHYDRAMDDERGGSEYANLKRRVALLFETWRA